MTERNYRKYTEAFKLEALALLERGEKTIGQIERELGITPGLLSKWRTRYQTVALGCTVSVASVVGINENA